MPIAIDKPSKYFNTLTWTGTGSSSGRSFTGVGFKPDLVWQKVRGTTYGHWIADAIRGSGKRLASNTTNAEESNSIYGYLTTFDTDGFTTVAGSTDNTGWNETSQTYVSWNWLGANTTASNNSGSITSTVSANTTSGFSIVSYTGNGTAGATVGHGLGVAPKMIIVKNRSSAGTEWITYHASIGNGKYLALQSTAGQAGTVTIWGTSSTTFTLAQAYSDYNGNGNNLIAYCFAEVKGFSKAFSYTGNGSADGNFVYCGFRPAFVLIKCTSNATDWFINDNKRLGYNGGNNVLYPDLSSAEATSPQVDILSNGFKTRTVDSMINNSGYTYVGFAFAEQPFVSSKGIVANAR